MDPKHTHAHMTRACLRASLVEAQNVMGIRHTQPEIAWREKIIPQLEALNVMSVRSGLLSHYFRQNSRFYCPASLVS